MEGTRNKSTLAIIKEIQCHEFLSIVNDRNSSNNNNIEMNATTYYSSSSSNNNRQSIFVTIFFVVLLCNLTLNPVDSCPEQK